VLDTINDLLCEITAMDACTFQPAAGAHGEFTGLLLIKKYLEQNGQQHRKKMLVPDSAHGTNPASAAMAGFETVHIPSDENGYVDVNVLKELLSDDIAGLMLTNPNTVGLLDPNILQITSLVHEHGGLCYYDGANLNAVLGHARPGDMGFDVVHLNLHKTFSTPHGGGGPGSGPVGCKEFLKEYLPGCALKNTISEKSIGQIRSFYGNFLVVVRALAYILTLGKEGLSEVSEMAVLNANYLMHLIKDKYTPAYDRPCMHEFVLTLSKEKKQFGVNALDAAKALLDRGMHPPTMYFPLIVDEALMIEPTETESKQTIEEAAKAFHEVYELMKENPEQLHESPICTIVSRPDETTAARRPILRYKFNEE
ncbi:MAG: aminomethyl-transferring glycine dehydrogenase subunit GcvPB, partial [Eubacteriales bacterium]|nr:aminomethyl-transferring glycine dehydrogenase subunit GcvPB [Eubacteriales bacterium]